MTRFASVRALSSSSRLLVEASKSCAFSVHCWWRSASAPESVFRSFFVTARAPSAVAFSSPLTPSACFAASMSLVANVMLSSSDCLSNSKACVLAVSVLRALDSWVLAFSRRLSRVPMMSPLWFSYTAAAGAPSSASSSLSPACCELCTNAVSVAPSAELSAVAWTRTSRAWATLAALFSCTIDAPPFRISRFRMASARSRASTASMSSCSSESKIAFSLARIVVAALRSASSVAMLVARSSVFMFRAPADDVSLAMVASSLSASDFPLLIWNARSFDRCSQNSENSS
mmetsp:Transcript_73457/g.208120  ORF Transcript_73457/g.208120 Transcript_73457/m.208120 type:complete len:288 (-) Transcript_73457:218-1081(-)